MKRIIQCMILAMLFSAGCKKECEYEEPRLIKQAKAEHHCDDISIIDKGENYRVLNVCGTRRFYEWGRWCSNCSFSWRERKMKKRNQEVKGKKKNENPSSD